MSDELILLQKLLASVVVGYLLGAVPFAQLAARLNGVDIFATGSGRAGTANVFWNVGRKVGTLVLVGDMAKGSLAVLIAQLLDISGALALLAGAAAVVGHWKSIFTGFRGGDGMATLMGVTITLVPALALIGIATGLLVLLVRWGSARRSAWGIATCFVVILAASQVYQTDRNLVLVLGLVLLAGLVLGHNFVTGQGASDSDEVAPLDALGLDADPEGDLAPPAPQNR
ncbi:MAG: glycerol-3-phosphate acyltransferase [Dehalococcoidia bacterium]|nr:glycerol-3-phosphate acyltransferase [Dehalococcoidia bacterium]MSQ17529.1 glycerol-3-phosphate acyltransferase [Dehalococcoidia bacterium]